ncbi:unnamed protein product [Notodromas monacha]|uniref:Uncharacterized protein n=1 Tax=Notodromas monacha TaxID=399045 RepID=A0A7R9G7T0_9CRUS|nr:unnamed protein product [Notodromas monacha]CAG0912396.1 unnamed protein product [Notodromas monacha]
MPSVDDIDCETHADAIARVNGVIPGERGKSLDPGATFHQEVVWREHSGLEAVRNRGGWPQEDIFVANNFVNNDIPSLRFSASNNSDCGLHSGVTSPASTSSTGCSSQSAQMPFSLFHRKRQNSDLEMPDGFVTPPIHTLMYRAQMAKLGNAASPPAPPDLVPKPTPSPQLSTSSKPKDKRWKLSNFFKRKPAKVADSEDASSSSSGSDLGPDSDYEIKRARKLKNPLTNGNAARLSGLSPDSLVAPSLKSMNAIPVVARRRWASGGSPSSGFLDTSKASSDSLSKERKRSSWKARAEAQRREQIGAGSATETEDECFGSASNRSSHRMSYASSPSLNSLSPSRQGPPKHKSRAARTERYIKRLSRDEETSQLTPPPGPQEPVTDSCVYYGKNWTALVSYETRPRIETNHVAKLPSAPATPTQSPSPGLRFPRPLSSQNFSPMATYYAYPRQYYPQYPPSRHSMLPGNDPQFQGSNRDCGVPFVGQGDGSAVGDHTAQYRSVHRPFQDCNRPEEPERRPYIEDGGRVMGPYPVYGGNVLASPKVVRAAVAPEEVPFARPPTPPPRLPSSKQSVAVNRPMSLIIGSAGVYAKSHLGHPFSQQGHKLMSFSSPPLGRGRAWEPHPRSVSPPVLPQPKIKQQYQVIDVPPAANVTQQWNPGRVAAKGPSIEKCPGLFGKPCDSHDTAAGLLLPSSRYQRTPVDRINGSGLPAKPGFQERQFNSVAPRVASSLTSLSDASSSNKNTKIIAKKLGIIANDRCDSALSSCSLQSAPWSVDGGRTREPVRVRASGFSSDSGWRRSFPVPPRGLPEQRPSNLVLDSSSAVSRTRRSGLTAVTPQPEPAKVPVSRSNFDFEQALHELETIYASLNLDDEELLDRADRREAACLYEKHMKAKGSAGDRNPSAMPPHPLAVMRRKTIASFPDKLNDDMAFRRAQLAQKFPEGKPVSPFQERSNSYLLVSPALSPAISFEFFDPAMLPPASSREPDITHDDVSYRNYRDANVSKILDPQPPFGIPLGPLPQSSPNDYLHAQPVPKPPVNSKEPDCVLDDMAFRNLRKDLKDRSATNSPTPLMIRSVKKDGSVDVEGLERLLETVGTTSDGGEPNSSIEEDMRIEWTQNPGWHRSVTPSPVFQRGRCNLPSLATKSRMRNAKRFSSHPDLRRADAAVGVGLVNKFFCVMPLPIERGETPPVKKLAYGGSPRILAEILQSLDNKPLLKPAESVPELRKSEGIFTPDDADVDHQQFLSKFPKKKKLPVIDFGPGPIGAIAALAQKLSAEEDVEDELPKPTSVSVSIVEVPSSSATMFSAIRSAKGSQPEPVEIEVIEPKPIVLEDTKPKHAEVIILPHDQDERAVITSPDDDATISSKDCDTGTRTSTLSSEESGIFYSSSPQCEDSPKVHPIPKPRKWNLQKSALVTLNDSTTLTPPRAEEMMTSTSNHFADTGAFGTESTDIDPSSGELSATKSKLARDTQNPQDLIQVCADNSMFWIVCYLIAFLHFCLGMDVFMMCTTMIAILAFLCALFL